MTKYGPIVFLEDDSDDQEFIREVIEGLNVRNDLMIFSTAMEAFKFLKETAIQPFIIFCDINLPMINGLEFKKMMEEDPSLKEKSIPFVFFSTSVDKASVEEAFEQMTVQGFFQKPANIPELKKMLQVIIDYWTLSKHPASDEY
ncbi:response regulator [Aridibaculum aurantiacum]|uniref:response regulator n=1 Tax=Aridibaculum aurantiacum TaxID=2810307 RepID=UPI001A9586DE|nr:response regulator [Aridibaculum aurantiacum]